MTRVEKIKMLTALQKGEKPLQEVLPVINVMLLETVPGIYIDMDGGKYVRVAADRIQAYIADLEKNNPNHVVNVGYMHYDEYRRISAELEAAY
jgi:hypothetical protein